MKIWEKSASDALFYFATEGVLITNSQGKIVNINPSAEKLFGYETGELLDQNVEVLVPDAVRMKHVAHRDSFNQKPHARSMGKGMDLNAKRKDGSFIPVEISLSPFTSSEGQFTLAFIIDISLRKKAEEKLIQYNSDLERQVKSRTMILEEAIQELEKTKEELNIALSKERELSELKTRFVSMASHEFRTPLATILSSLSLVKKYGEINETEKQYKHIDRIKTSVRDLTEILNDFLSVSKLDEGKVQVEKNTISIKQLFSNIVSEFEVQLKEEQKLVYNHEGDLFYCTDSKILKNIVANLVSNALKFSGSKAYVLLKTTIVNNEFYFSVSDNGIGIPEEDQKHLFERFFRAKNAQNIQGTGLGLSIVAQFVHLLNGNISFKSKYGEGTTFTINFHE